MFFELTIAIFSLLFSAFFSGVEIAFISSNKLQLELDKNKNKFSSKLIAFFSKNESDFITTMLVGNNISLVVYGLLVSQILSPYLELFLSTDFLILICQTFIATIIVLFTAEFIPKAIFRLYPNQILNILSVPIFILFILLRPAAVLMLKIANLFLKFIFNQKIAFDKQSFGKTDLDDILFYNSKKVPIDETGEFLIGLGRKHPIFGELKVIKPTSETIIKKIEIKQREYKIQKINNLKKRKVNTTKKFISK